MPDMMSIVNLLAPLPSDGIYNVYRIICLVLLVVMMAGALVSILIILFQPGNSTGIDALGGSSETFFGKNKGRSMESRMKLDGDLPRGALRARDLVLHSSDRCDLGRLI